MTQKVVSTWSLHRTLGTFVAGELRGHPTGFGGSVAPREPADGALSLLELPARLRAHGYDGVQLVHFHLPSRDPGYLAELRGEFERNGIRQDTFLVDDGDLTGEDAAEHEAWIGEWLDDAVRLGFPRARLIAGRSDPTPETIARGAAALARIAEAHPDIRVVTENWMALMRDAASVNAVLDAAGDRVGLLVDLANWTAPDTNEQLALIAGRGETCHAKGRVGRELFAPGAEGVQDYIDAIAAIHGAGFSGTLALVYDGPDADELAALDAQFELTDALAP